MKNLYCESFVTQLNAKKKRSMIMLIVIMIVATILNSGLLFLSNENNATLMQVVMSVIYVCAGWVSIWLLFNGVLSRKKKIAFINGVQSGDIKEIVCTVKSVGKPITLPNSNKFYEITALSGGTALKLYYDASFDVDDINAGANVIFNVSDNYIIAYKVIGYEE